MRKMVLQGVICGALLVGLFVAGSQLPAMAESGATLAAGAGTEQSVQHEVVTGKVVGVSQKAKTVSLEVGDTTVMVRFDDRTSGVEHAQKGHAAIIEYTGSGTDKLAVVIKPKLAKLPQGTSEMQPEELAVLIDKGEGGYVLIDSRPAKRFHEGTIPTAISIPVPLLKEKGAALLPEDKSTPLIFFCGGVTCGLSTSSAGMAVKMGYTDVKVMLKGEPGWKKAGRPVVASKKQIEEGNIVLVDLRSQADYQAAHMPRAYNIPLAQLDDAEDLFPVSQAAPVVLYGNGNDVAKGYEIVAEWGRKNVSVAIMDFSAWQAAGLPVESGPSPTRIVWKRQMGKNEIGIREFIQVAEGNPSDKLILDVRTDDEVQAGKFAASQHVALDKLPSVIDSLPKDKEILVHCTTGARAEMASTELRKAGFRSRFLVASVACEGPDCSVTE